MLPRLPRPSGGGLDAVRTLLDLGLLASKNVDTEVMRVLLDAGADGCPGGPTEAAADGRNPGRVDRGCPGGPTETVGASEAG